MNDPEYEREHLVAIGTPEMVRRESARRTRRSFLVGGVAAAAGYAAWHAVNNSRPVGRLQSGLRDVLDANAAVNRAVFREHGLSPTFPLERAMPLRMNGSIGMMQALAPASWRLQVAGVRDAQSSPFFSPDVTAWDYRYTGGTLTDSAPDLKSGTGTPRVQMPVNLAGPSADAGAGSEAVARQTGGKRRVGNAEAGASGSSLNIGTPGLLLPMEVLRQLPRVEFVTEFKCIEGWSQITRWGGVRLRDLIDAFPPAAVNGRTPQYVYVETPDGNYYCGYDMEAARHPQSTLVMEMGGAPLSPEHGAPLRLHMPIKYGYKQLKRVGLIAYMDGKPDDYWEKLGYDWYAGL